MPSAILEPRKATGGLPCCPHSVYDPHGDGRYCTICTTPQQTPQENTEASKQYWNGVLDRDGLSLQTLNANANLNDPDSAGLLCPSCHSSAHYEGKDGKWECADCGEKYTPKRRVAVRRAQMDSVMHCPECHFDVYFEATDEGKLVCPSCSASYDSASEISS